jgi:hypothetical protein
MLFIKNLNRVWQIAFSACLIVFFSISSSEAQEAPANLDFESPDPNGYLGPPWFTGEFQDSYDVSLESGGAYHGNYWVRIRSITKPEAKEFANVIQTFDAKPYLGRFIRYRAATKQIGKLPGEVRMWMRVEAPEKRTRFFSSRTDRPIKSTEWEEYQIIGYVAQDAKAIYIGCSLQGEGTVGFDDVTIDTVSIGSGGNIYDFQMPEKLTFNIADGKTEEVSTYDIAKITASAGKAVVTLNNSRQIEVTGNYDELARYFEKTR